MTEILVTRNYKKEGYTIGKMYINGDYFCDTLEDPVREPFIKIAGNTAIPAGRYEVKITHSPRFHRDLPLLISVPQFEGVRIHSGNTAKDTEGCILVGRNTVRGAVTNSRAYEQLLIRRLRAAGEPIYITIKNE